MRKKTDPGKQVPASPENEVFEAIHAVMHLYRSHQYRAVRDGSHDLTHMENKVLGFFARHPDATQSDLVTHSGRDKAQLTRLIRGLRDKGLLDARVDETDRRSTRLQLTPEGQAIHKEAREHAARLSSAAVAGLSEEECRQLVSLLAKVRDNLGTEAQ
jgi:DNA-binding MarR family transcriptional regulator